MKVAIILEQIRQIDLTVDQLVSKWNELKNISCGEEIEIVMSQRYPSIEEMDDFVKDADALFGVWITDELIQESFFRKHPNLKYIATLGHGYQSFDYEMTKRLGVTITNTVYGAQTIAEHAFALMLHCCRNISIHDERVKTIDWSKKENGPEYIKAVTPMIELYGKTVGIIGLGEIGFAFAKMAHGFGMKVISYSRHIKQGEEYSFIKQVDDLDELLEKSDFVSLHLPENGNEHFIDENMIQRMKDGVILINTARGILIDENALSNALKSGKVRAAALDVLEEEPPIQGSPLLTAPNCTITPHIAWLTRESRFRAIDMAIENYANFLSGKPTSVINK